MKNLKKKGFTIVELVIVIAVIAVLAAVLIPTFVNLTKKANETSDIQAVRNMNVFLAQAEALGEVDSILDVYEVFEESDYVVENYQPLYKGRYFYYDKQQKQVLYVDENNKVLFPSNLEGTTQGTNDWFSLSMEIKTEAVSDTNGVYTITKAEQYAYVVEQLNKAMPSEIIIDIQGDLDFKGAQVTIEKIAAEKSLTINGNGHTIKNITSNTPMLMSNDNAAKQYSNYYCAGLVADVSGDLTINKVKFENINVKSINCSGVALLVGGTLNSVDQGSFIFNDVSIKNSSVIGNRNVGALIGYINSSANGAVSADNVKLENVNVFTVVGSSGLLYGAPAGNAKNDIPTDIEIKNCIFDVYECELNTGKCALCGEDCDVDGSDGAIHGYSYDADGTVRCRKDKGVSFSKNALYYNDGR